MNNRPVHDESDLLGRLTKRATSSRKSVVFLVGSPLVAPVQPHEPGIPGVEGMIDLIQEAMEGQLELSPGTSMARYQQAFFKLDVRHGQDGVNRVIRRAVLRARWQPPVGADREAAEEGKTGICEALEADVDGWALNPSITSLGSILAEYGTPFGEILLTSNFDPLIEVSLRKAGASFFFSTLHADGSLGLTRGQGCHVVHFHGYWNGSDTLHIPWHLQRPRPQLLASLASLLRERTVVVVAYGGWDDVFTRALGSIAHDPMAFPEVLWTFPETDPQEVSERFRDRMASLQHAVQPPRIQLYRGVDVRTFFSSLLEALRRDVPRARSTLLRQPITPSHLELPPDDGLPTTFAAQGLPALPVEETDLRTLPLDVGTVWGLDRGVFLGLLSGGSQDSAFEALLRSEAALWRVRRDCEVSVKLPIRWWLRIGAGERTIPGTPPQLWSAVRDKGSLRLKHLQEQGMNEDLILGIFLEAHADSGDPLPELSAWCTALARMFPQKPPSIVIHLGRTDAGTASHIAQQLERLLGQTGPRLDALRLLMRREEPPPVPANHSSLEPAPHLAGQIGSEVSGWLGIEGRVMRSEDDELAMRLVAQLDAGEDRVPEGSDRELLEWSARHHPERIDPLLGAYARSARWQGRRESLLFAAQADQWADTWLNGAQLSDPALVELVALADPRSGAVADDLALAIMRRTRRAADPEAGEMLLKKLAHRLSPELRVIDRLRQAETVERTDEFLVSHGLRAHRLALRAGLDLWPSRAFLHRLDIEQIDLWRLLTALPVTGERIRDLLTLADPARRAVFGLCTQEEWAAVRREPLVERLIRDARRDRSLNFPGNT